MRRGRSGRGEEDDVSVKHALLALLCEGPRYGYELKASFEARTGDAWPLNVGQVYTTLARLERDGQVARDSEDAEGHVHYRLTGAGRREVQGWWDGEVEREAPPRDELAIKLALALTVPGVDVLGVLQRQRTATVRALQTHVRRRSALAAAEPAGAALLVLESLVFAAEAEVRWLDHCEARLLRAARTGTRTSTPRPGTASPSTAGPSTAGPSTPRPSTPRPSTPSNGATR